MGSNQSSRDPRERYYHFGRLVVREGEAVSIFDNNGSQRVVFGASAFHVWFSEVIFLKRFSCDEQSYLIIDFLDGRKEHRRGPAFMFLDPCAHKDIKVERSIMLEANQVLVVYTENTLEKDDVVTKNVTRRIVRGPEIFIPQANEWLHKFSWHGTVIAVSGKSKGSITGQPGDVKTAHAVEFTKLRQLPDQMYYTVRDLRTRDDALLTLHIMIFFELVDIEKMLNETNDPISDIINAANADVMTYGAGRTYEALLADSSGLSEISAYPLLTMRMQSIGYKLIKVVYRGYQTSSQLQAMQETAISSRTQLRLQADTQRHEQENLKNRLIAEEEQAVYKFSQEKKAAEHKARLLQLKADQELAAARAKNEAELSHKRALNDQRLEFLKSLSDLNVELTKYLVAEVSSKPTSHLLIENVRDNSAAPNLHLHGICNKL